MPIINDKLMMIIIFFLKPYILTFYIKLLFFFIFVLPLLFLYILF